MIPNFQQNLARYLESPSCCPYCESHRLEAEPVHYPDGGGVHQRVQCLACYHTWTDVLGVVGIIEDPPEANV